jgi:succinoglycan biosynthesis protein ExoA
MSGATVDCSILVPVVNEERYIEPMVAAMRAQRFDGTLEFVFADGGSTDRTREILGELAREDLRIRLFDNPRGSVSSGLNVALREARGTWAARMDGHSVYPADYVAHGIGRLERGDSPWISGPQHPRGHNPVSRAIELALESPLGRGGSRKWAPPTPPTPPTPPAPPTLTPGQGAPGDEFELDTGVFGGVWRRQTLLDYGGWDERWDKNEDSELAARFLRRGERLICLPSMSADYAPRDTLRGLWRQYRDYGRFRALTARHHPRSMRRSHLIAPALVVDAALALTPGRLGTLARVGVGIYGAALVASGVQAARRAEHPADAALVPAVLAAMHGAHGVGEIAGAIRYGPPWAALALAAGLGGAAEEPAVDGQAVFAPSLN